MKQNHPELRAVSKQVLNSSKDGDSTTSVDSLFQCLPTLTVKKIFLLFKCDFLYFNICLLPLVLSLGTTLAPPSLLPPLRIYTYGPDAPETFFPGRRVPVLSACPCMRHAPVLSSSLQPFAGAAPVSACLPCTREPRTRHSVTDEQRGRIASLDLLAMFLLMQPRIIVSQK